MGELTNIDQDGFASAAFHSFPDMLSFDPYSGDYGSGFWGFAANTATYVVRDDSLGWLSFGGNLQKQGNAIRVIPLDAFRSRLYLAPMGLWFTLDAGRFRQAALDMRTGEVRLTLETATATTSEARLRIEQPATVGRAGTYSPDAQFRTERGAYVVPLQAQAHEIVLRSSGTHAH